MHYMQTEETVVVSAYTGDIIQYFTVMGKVFKKLSLKDFFSFLVFIS